MCTVTYIPTKEGFYLTSSRDEQAGRPTTLPAKYTIDGTDLFFPRDGRAGGTWIAADYKGRTACLLNGAFVRHIRRDTYARSRGLVLLESFQYGDMREFSIKTALKDVEPFTMIMIDHRPEHSSGFMELRWDGAEKYLKELNRASCQIWSSATLYSPEARLKREEVFEAWIETFRDREDRNILEFHSSTHGLGANDDIIMKGDGDLMTLSISQADYTRDPPVFRYLDILNGKAYSAELQNIPV